MYWLQGSKKECEFCKVTIFEKTKVNPKQLSSIFQLLLNFYFASDLTMCYWPRPKNVESGPRFPEVCSFPPPLND